MAAGAGADDADTVCVDGPFAGAGADYANSARRVFEHARVTITAGTEAVFENKSVNTE